MSSPRKQLRDYASLYIYLGLLGSLTQIGHERSLQIYEL